MALRGVPKQGQGMAERDDATAQPCAAVAQKSNTKQEQRMSTTKPTTPFMEGFAAFERGKDIHSSPYPQGSRQRTKWVNGWQWAQRQAQNAREAAQLEAINNRPLPDWVTAQEAIK